jgi:hypothetical protein
VLATASLVVWSCQGGAIGDHPGDTFSGGDGPAGADHGTGDADGSSGDPAAGACNLDAAVPPWPAWVPAWPGSGRNATGNTTFRFLDVGAAVESLATESVTATSAVVTWTTAGDADSSIGWGLSPQSCPVGYHRTGARREHRLLMAPLLPSTTYHVTVRSRDGVSTGWGNLSFTTTAESAATPLGACATLATPGSYRLTADVSAACTCFDLQADGVTLDLGWHTVTYATTETSSQCHGIAMNGDGGHVARGIVVQGAAGGGLFSHAIRGYGAAGLAIEQLWLHVARADAFGVRTMYSGDVTVRDSLLVSDVTQVTDRHYPGNGAIQLDLSPADAVAAVYDNILFRFPHWGINLTGDDRLTTRPAAATPLRRVFNNHLFANMTATNGYALGLHANFVEAHHNEVRPIYNGRAVHYAASAGNIHHNIIEAVERIHGETASGYQQYSDIADPNSPHDVGVCTWVVAHTLRVEGGNFGEIHHNEVYAFSLPQVSFGATGLNINVGADGVGAGNDIHHNQFTAHRAPGSISCSGGLPVRAGWVWGEAPSEANTLADNVFRSNGETLDIEDPAFATSTDDIEESY